MMINKKSPQLEGAFSLIEMMVVLGLVAVLLSFAAPNLFSLIGSNSLTGEGSLIQNQLTFAQQNAVSKSADVEVRFFRLKDESAAQVDEAFRAFQLYQYTPEGDMVPISQFFRIRPPVAIHEGLSTLLDPRAAGDADSPSETAGDPDNLVPVGKGGEKIEASYVSFRFRPDGSTDLPYAAEGEGAGGAERDTWYLTLVQGEGALKDQEPDNFVCLQLNPYNGKINMFRP